MSDEMTRKDAPQEEAEPTEVQSGSETAASTTTAAAAVAAVEPTDDGLVDVHDADTASLDAALANAIAQEESPAEGPEPEAAEPVVKQQAATVPATKKVDPSKPAQPAERRDYTPEEVQAITAENKRLKEQGDQKELFIQRRGTELGALRQQLAARETELKTLRQQLENGLEDQSRENPLQAMKDQKKIEQIDSELEGLNKTGSRAQNIVEAQTFYLRNVDTEKVSFDDIAEMLKSDGVDEQYVAAFKANPWEWTTPEALVQMGKRTEERRLYIEADDNRRVLAKYVMHLKAENEKLRGKPRQVLAQVQKHLNKPQAMTAAQSASPKTVRDLDPTKMSTQELDLALKQATRH